MKAPYRFQQLAKATVTLIQVFKLYRRDANSSQVNPSEMGRNISDMITVALSDSGFSEDEQKMVANNLIEDLRTKFGIKK